MTAVKYFLNNTLNTESQKHSGIAWPLLLHTFAFLLLPFTFFAQDTLDLKLKLVLHHSAKFATADQLHNFYIVTPENEILKFDSIGNEQFRFSNNQLGNITSFDASNPFNLLVFYQDFNVVKTLDRTLTESGEFNLFDVGIFQTPCVGISADKNLWVYDRDDSQLKKINKKGEIILESTQLNILFDVNLNPVSIVESGNNVYLLDNGEGIWVFDIYGKFEAEFPVKTYDFQPKFENGFHPFGRGMYFINEENALINFIPGIPSMIKRRELPEKVREGKSFFKEEWIFQIKEKTVEIFKMD